jgi:hypothetical protein
MIRHRKIRMRMRNHMVTLKVEEVPKEDHLVGEIIFLEEEEEVEEVELNVMLVKDRKHVLKMPREEERRRRRITHF